MQTLGGVRRETLLDSLGDLVRGGGARLRGYRLAEATERVGTQARAALVRVSNGRCCHRNTNNTNTGGDKGAEQDFRDHVLFSMSVVTEILGK